MDKRIKSKRKYSKTQIATGVFLLAIAGGIIAKLIWTDRNTHDPGVTSLDLLSYSIDDESDDTYTDDFKKYNPD